MKISISTENAFLSLAIKTLLQEYLYQDAIVDIQNKPSAHNVAEYDVIFMSILPGEQFICYPYLQHRKKGSKLVLVTKDRSSLRFNKLPHCLNDASIIDRKTTAIDFYYIFSSMFTKKCHSSSTDKDPLCFNCPCAYLTPTQLKVSHSFMNGISVNEIANEMGLSDKTVYAQKRKIMDRFNISSDQDLFNLFKGIKLTHGVPLVKG